jgi:O-antigen ligase
LGAIAFFGARQGLGRWLESSAFDVVWGSRVAVYWQCLRLWWRFPLTGTGLGTFRQAFPLVQPAEPPGTWTHAHNDVLELLTTGGVVALPLVGWGLWHLARHLRRVFHLGRRSEDRAAGLAALGALAAALVHSLVDFSLTVPANALTLAIVCGMAAGAAVDTLGPRSPEPGRQRRANQLSGKMMAPFRSESRVYHWTAAESLQRSEVPRNAASSGEGSRGSPGLV